MSTQATNELGISRISPSMLMEFESCPRLFYYRSWLGLKLPQAQRHLRFGSAIHLAIDNMYEQFNEVTKWNKASVDTMIGTFLKNWSLDCIGDDEFPTRKEKEECFEEMKEDGVEMLKQLWDKKEELYADGFEPVEFEIPFKGVLHHPITKKPFEIPHSMRIDSRAKRNRIGEFKTSSKPYDPEETKGSMQALSYAFTDYILTGTIPQIDYIVLIKKRKKDKVQHIPITYTETDMLRYVERLEATFDKIRKREFRLNERCRIPYCDCHKFELLLKVD